MIYFKCDPSGANSVAAHIISTVPGDTYKEINSLIVPLCNMNQAVVKT